MAHTNEEFALELFMDYMSNYQTQKRVHYGFGDVKKEQIISREELFEKYKNLLQYISTKVNVFFVQKSSYAIEMIRYLVKGYLYHEKELKENDLDFIVVVYIYALYYIYNQERFNKFSRFPLYFFTGMRTFFKTFNDTDLNQHCKEILMHHTMYDNPVELVNIIKSI